MMALVSIKLVILLFCKHPPSTKKIYFSYILWSVVRSSMSMFKPFFIKNATVLRKRQNSIPDLRPEF